MSRSYQVIGNWKMNANKKMVADWAGEMNDWAGKNINQNQINFRLGICPPYLYIDAFSQELELSRGENKILLGAQDVSAFESGAYSGEVSALMLKELNCHFSIVGHSEAREYLNQSDKTINAKLKQLIKVGITPILCVGESLEVREQNQANQFVVKQLKSALDGIDNPGLVKLIIAYEPIWAIGTGKTATSEVANQMHQEIYQLVSDQLGFKNLSVIYGGSVNGKNAKELFKMPKIDGALVGGASLNSKQFQQICGVALCLTSY